MPLPVKALIHISVYHYLSTIEVEGLLERSFPAPGDAAVIRQMFAESLADDGLGMQTQREGDRIVGVYPIAVLVATV